MDKNFYNEASAAKLGWEPSWFGEKYFDDKLVRAIKKWQKERGLNGDGLCGPMTFRRLWTERQSAIDEHKPEGGEYTNYIIYNGEFYPIEWDKFVLWSEKTGLQSRRGNYYDSPDVRKGRFVTSLIIGMSASHPPRARTY